MGRDKDNSGLDSQCLGSSEGFKRENEENEVLGFSCSKVTPDTLQRVGGLEVGK